MRDVAGVTLLCVDTANHALALRALAVSGAELRFEQTLFLTDSIPAHLDVPPGIAVRPIARLASRDEYSRFVLKSLLAHVTIHPTRSIRAPMTSSRRSRRTRCLTSRRNGSR